VRTTLRWVGVGTHLVRGCAVASRFPTHTPVQRHAAVERWSQGLLTALGVQPRVQGEPQQGPVLVVSNHVSWLDPATLHAANGRLRFVAKSEVRGWPLIGWLAAQSGGLFVRRDNQRDVLRVVQTVAQALTGGDAVAFFPEGTTGHGPELKPFHANLLEAAIAAGVPVQPVLLRYTQPGQAFAKAARYVDGMTLVGSFGRMARTPGLGVAVDWLPAVTPNGYSRRALATQLREQMQAGLNQALP